MKIPGPLQSPDTLQHTATHSDTQNFNQPPVYPLKLRSDCALARLNPAQLHDLFNWLITEPYEDVLKRLEEQFAVKTHHTTLSRFFHLYARRLNAEELTDLLQPNDPAAPALAHAAEDALLHRLFEVSRTPQAHSRINELSRALGRSRDKQARQLQLQIARDRLALQTRAFEYNAVREVMKHLVELIRIHNLPDLDDQDKILQAEQIIFPKDQGPS